MCIKCQSLFYGKNSMNLLSAELAQRMVVVQAELNIPDEVKKVGCDIRVVGLGGSDWRPRGPSSTPAEVGNILCGDCS